MVLLLYASCLRCRLVVPVLVVVDCRVLGWAVMLTVEGDKVLKQPQACTCTKAILLLLQLAELDTSGTRSSGMKLKRCRRKRVKKNVNEMVTYR